jgi:glycopeptide antibiotics resistance protein
MKKLLDKFRFADTWVLLAASLFLLLFFTLEVLLRLPQSAVSRSLLLRSVLLILIGLLFYMGGLLHVDRTGSNTVLRALFLLFLLLYLYLLADLTLLEKGFGRGGLMDDVGDKRTYYLENYVNLIPCHSIYTVYIKGFINGYVSPYYMVINLLGNVCMLMPLSLLLPAAMRAARRWFIFLPILLGTILGIELLQLWFMRGSCDVDDLLLNFSGAAALYFLMRIPPVRRFLHRCVAPLTAKEGR